MGVDSVIKRKTADNLDGAIKVLKLVFFLYLFLLSLELMKGSFECFGKGFTEVLFRTTSNPLVAMSIGILATSILQSSSTTTSIIVALVGAGQLDISNAVPIVMGANIGTVVTNILVALGYVTRKEEFRRAYAQSMMNASFKCLAVATLLPLEVLFHPLERMASVLQRQFEQCGGMRLFNPVKPAVEPVVHLLTQAIRAPFQEGSTVPPVAILVVALVLMFISLMFLVEVLKSIMFGRLETLVHKYLFAKPMRAFVLGLVVTALVQSSSVTTSLAIPLVASGLLTLEAVFPYVLGSDVGTTITAILAAMVIGKPEGVVLAFCHLLFNVFGVCLFYPLRTIPITIAHFLGNLAYHSRVKAVVCALALYFLIPALIILLFGR